MSLFATAINCMDGRTQKPVFDYLAEHFGVTYVDMITEPGPIKILSENQDPHTIEAIKNKVLISINKHHSKVVAVVGHHDCAGNPVDNQQQHAQILQSIDLIKQWQLPVELIGLWVDEQWVVNPVK